MQTNKVQNKQELKQTNKQIHYKKTGVISEYWILRLYSVSVNC